MDERLRAEMNLLYELIEDEDSDQTGKGDDGFHDGPSFESFFYCEIEVFFEHPKSSIIHMRKHETSCSCSQNHQFGIGAAFHDERKNDSCCGESCYRSRAHADPDDRRDTPCQNQRRHFDILKHKADIVTDSTVYQDFLQCSCSCDDQQNHRNAPDRFFNAFRYFVHSSSSSFTQCINSNKNSDQHCDDRITDYIDEFAQRGICLNEDLENRS